MAEAKALARLGLELPAAARTVLLQEEKFQVYYETLSHALKVGAPQSSIGKPKFPSFSPAACTAEPAVATCAHPACHVNSTNSWWRS